MLVVGEAVEDGPGLVCDEDVVVQARGRRGRVQAPEAGPLPPGQWLVEDVEVGETSQTSSRIIFTFQSAIL